MHRLLGALASDFYRPFRLASLHALLYPDQYFNPVSSPARFHQATRQLRAWLKASGLSLRLEETDGLYRLRGKGALVVGPAPCGMRNDTAMSRLQREFGGGPFAIADAMKRLDLPGALPSGSCRKGTNRVSWCGKAKGPAPVIA